MSCGLVGHLSQPLSEFEWTVPDYPSLDGVSDRDHAFDSPTFAFSDCTWYLRIFPNRTETMAPLFLCMGDSPSPGGDKKLTITFGLKKPDGTVEKKNPCSHTFKKGQWSKGDDRFLNRVELLRQASGALTITCCMADEAPSPLEVVPKRTQLIETLSANFQSLFARNIDCDVTLKVQERKFQAHKIILNARCPELAAAFDGVGHTTMKDCDPDSFGDFLKYLYTGKVGGDMSFVKTCDLYATANKYHDEMLKSVCSAHIALKLGVANVLDVAAMADKYCDTGLYVPAQIFFNRNVSGVLLTNKWRTLVGDNFLLANKLLKNMAGALDRALKRL